jgi:hypothetical protein
MDGAFELHRSAALPPARNVHAAICDALLLSGTVAKHGLVAGSEVPLPFQEAGIAGNARGRCRPCLVHMRACERDGCVWWPLRWHGATDAGSAEAFTAALSRRSRSDVEWRVRAPWANSSVEPERDGSRRVSSRRPAARTRLRPASELSLPPVRRLRNRHEQECSDDVWPWRRRHCPRPRTCRP